MQGARRNSEIRKSLVEIWSKKAATSVPPSARFRWLSVLEKFIEEERNFTQKIQEQRAVFFRPLFKGSFKFMKDHVMSALMNNLEAIVRMSQMFVNATQEMLDTIATDDVKDETRICKMINCLFITYTPMFTLYARHHKHAHRAIEVLTRERKEDKKLRNVLIGCEFFSNGQDIDGFIKFPTQRFQEYLNLSEELRGNFAPGSAAGKAFEGSHRIILSIRTEVLELTKKYAAESKYQKMKEKYNIVEISKAAADRVLLLDTLACRISGNKKRMMRFILFADTLMCANEKAIKGEHPLAQCALADESELKDKLRKRQIGVCTKGKSFTIEFEDVHEKEEWHQALSRAISRQRTVKTGSSARPKGLKDISGGAGKTCAFCNKGIGTFWSKAYRCDRCEKPICGKCSKTGLQLAKPVTAADKIALASQIMGLEDGAAQQKKDTRRFCAPCANQELAERQAEQEALEAQREAELNGYELNPGDSEMMFKQSADLAPATGASKQKLPGMVSRNGSVRTEGSMMDSSMSMKADAEEKETSQGSEAGSRRDSKSVTYNPKESKRMTIARDLLTGEGDYVDLLRKVVRTFVRPTYLMLKNKLIASLPEDTLRFFNSLEQIYAVHQHILKEIKFRIERIDKEKWREEKDRDCYLGELFLMMKPLCTVYKQYFMKLEATVKLMEDPTMMKSFEKQHSALENSLQTYILLPIKRLEKYRATMRALLTCIENEHQDRPMLRTSLRVVEVQIREAPAAKALPSSIRKFTKDTFENLARIAREGKEISIDMRTKIVLTIKDCIPFFDTIPDDTFRTMAQECHVESFQTNQIVFNEGDIGDRFYIILYGEVAASVEGEVVARLSEGKYFGEIALVIEDTARTATCTATTESVLLSMSKTSFGNFFADRPEALADVELRIAGKKCKIRSIIYHPEGVRLFNQYLQTQYAEENLLFWNEVREYRKWVGTMDMEDSEDNKEVQRRAKEIYDKYIDDDSDLKVNLSSTMSSKIYSQVLDGKATQKSFLKAEDEVVNLMSQKLGHFKQSPEFASLVQVVGEYEVTKETKKRGVKRGGSRELLPTFVKSAQSWQNPTPDNPPSRLPAASKFRGRSPPPMPGRGLRIDTEGHCIFQRYHSVGHMLEDQRVLSWLEQCSFSNHHILALFYQLEVMEKKKPNAERHRVVGMAIFEKNRVVAFAMASTSKHLFIAPSMESHRSPAIFLLAGEIYRISAKLNLESVMGPSAEVNFFQQCWTLVTPAKATLSSSIRTFVIEGLPTVEPKAHARPGELVAATQDHAKTLSEFYRNFMHEARRQTKTIEEATGWVMDMINKGRLYVFLVADKSKNWEEKLPAEEKNTPVTMFAVAGRGSNFVTLHCIYTPKARRGCGYASSAIKEFTSKVLTDSLKTYDVMGIEKIIITTDEGFAVAETMCKEIGLDELKDTAMSEARFEYPKLSSGNKPK
uniref:Uncharacterized protein n=1 Tax=Lotharella globosa TaxID=91324 RepID=A0A7S4DM18_9EUKA|mmetsp:Transcript_16828/g.34062  ORF Transcript_16828/g.34062 Transcript_16828/m.34062 type:complete len:1442 (+) Transcript_16828:87-4412(+)